jgi:putative redox protein
MSDTLVVHWRGDMVFETDTPSGGNFKMDTHPDYGGGRNGPTPVEALLASAAACGAIDVLSVMQKKKQEITDYRIEVEWERGPQGVYPRPITAMRIRHIVNGENLDPAAMERAVQLSDEKYCSVLATLRIPVDVKSTWEIV